MDLYVRNSQLQYNKWSPIGDLGVLRILWNAAPNSHHTIMIYDVDAPSSTNPTNSPYLHYLVINIPGNNLSQGQQVIPYMLPSPPIGSGQHRYIVALYRQIGPISNITINERARFDINTFVTKNGLQLIVNEVIVADPDRNEFSRSSYPVEQQPTNITVNPNHPLIIADTTLSDQEQKFCSCVVKAAGDQPGSCNLEQAWFEERDGRVCANPFAVCAKSTGTSSRACPANYNYSQLTGPQLIALANLLKVPVTQDRSAMVAALKAK